MATPEGDGIVCMLAKRNNPSFLRGVLFIYFFFGWISK